MGRQGGEDSCPPTVIVHTSASFLMFMLLKGHVLPHPVLTAAAVHQMMFWSIRRQTHFLLLPQDVFKSRKTAEAEFLTVVVHWLFSFLLIFTFSELWHHTATALQVFPLCGNGNSKSLPPDGEQAAVPGRNNIAASAETSPITHHSLVTCSAPSQLAPLQEQRWGQESLF